jgi:ABC-2 type transport system ATP-binding protein
MPAAIETRGLTKDYLVGFWRPRPYRALHELTLTVEAGEIFGFLGPNGAGKSTTIKLLMQLIYPSGGDAQIFGRPPGDLSVRRRLGYLAENPYYYDYLTAEEVLTYFAKLLHVPAAGLAARVSRTLDEVGIGAERRMRLRQFSKGMLQRVGLAQAIIHEPELVVLDEPMSGLDPIGRRQVRDLIRTLRDRGCTVFFSSHILSDAEVLCTRVGIMAQGRLVSSGRLSEMVAYELKGWEIVAAGINSALEAELRAKVQGIAALADGRYTIQLAPDARPEAMLAELTSRGATVESMNPVRDTLEDFFLRQVSSAEARQTAGL